MLRVLQRSQSRLQSYLLGSSASLRSASTAVSTASDLTALSQLDAVAAKQDPNDPHIKVLKEMRDLKIAIDKLDAEKQSRNKGPAGLVTLANGQIDEEFYVKQQGIHPSFISGLKTLMAEDAKDVPEPKIDTKWATTMKKMAPMFKTESERCAEQIRKLEAQKATLEEVNDRLDEITVDEMLEKYPELAQEIKDEIEAGILEPTDAGFKIPENAVAK